MKIAIATSLVVATLLAVSHSFAENTGESASTASLLAPCSEPTFVSVIPPREREREVVWTPARIVITSSLAAVGTTGIVAGFSLHPGSGETPLFSGKPPTIRGLQLTNNGEGSALQVTSFATGGVALGAAIGTLVYWTLHPTSVVRLAPAFSSSYGGVALSGSF